MAEIHPNDIGLATFDDVGDVRKLKTSAKSIVDALNEIYQNGTQNGLGKQLYVDGENNIILGENNIVYGNNNLIIGSDNIVVGDNINMIANKRQKLKFLEIWVNSLDIATGKISYSIGDEESVSPFKVGDKIVLSVSLSWTNSEWSDRISIVSPLKIVKILDINNDEDYIIVENDFGIPAEPPDETHTIKDYQSIDAFVPLIDEFKIIGDSKSISFGGTSTGVASFSACAGTASGSHSFSANSSNAKGNYSSAFGTATAGGDYGFAAGSSNAEGEKSAALNSAYAYAPNSLGVGFSSRVYVRALKCTNIDRDNKILTIDSNYSLSGIKREI